MRDIGGKCVVIGRAIGARQSDDRHCYRTQSQSTDDYRYVADETVDADAALDLRVEAADELYDWLREDEDAANA